MLEGFLVGRKSGAEPVVQTSVSAECVCGAVLPYNGATPSAGVGTF